MSIQIITNNVNRELIYAHDLTKQDIKTLGFDAEELAEAIDCGDNFFRYRGHVYNLNEFVRIENNSELKEWQGYASDTFFSGVLVKLSECGEAVTVGRYYS